MAQKRTAVPTPSPPPVPEAPAEAVEPTFGLVPIDQIDVSEDHKRPLGEIDELAQTIAQDGLLQPIIVREGPDGRYDLMAGWRRLNAVSRLGRTMIEAQVRPADDTTRRVVRTVENVQRMQLDPIQEGQEYQRLNSEDGLEVHQIARRVGRSPLHVTNRLLLLTLPPEMQAEVGQVGGLSIGEAESLASIAEHPDHLAAAYKSLKAGTPANAAVQAQRTKLARLTQVKQKQAEIVARGDTVFEGSIGTGGYAVVNDAPHPGCFFWPYEADAEDFQYGVSPEAEEFAVCVNPTLHLNDSDVRVQESAQALLQTAETGSAEAPAQPLTPDEVQKRKEATERKHFRDLKKQAELRQVHLTKVARGGPKSADDELIDRAFLDSLSPDVREAVHARCNVARVQMAEGEGLGEKWDLESYLTGRGSYHKLARAAALELHERDMERHIKDKTRLLHGQAQERAGRYLEYLEGTGYALTQGECDLAGLEREPEGEESEEGGDDE